MTADRQEIGRKHARVLHICECGRQIYGNSFYLHKDRCESQKPKCALCGKLESAHEYWMHVFRVQQEPAR